MKKSLLSLTAICCFVTAFANNISVSNVSLTSKNVTAHTIKINFAVAWENSWRTSTNENNYDGAWVFIKYRVSGTSDWRHCTLNTTGVTAGAGDTIKVSSDKKGAFVFRSADGIGNVNFTGNKVTWNYGSDSVADNANVEIRVFALEMVYIPTGAYYLGSGGTETNCFKQGNTAQSYMVTNAGAIPTGTSGNVLNFNGNGSATGNQIPATYPNGFNAYWTMKYECSQQQYADFLNSLSNQQATTLKLSGTVIFGSTAWPDFIPVAPEQANRYTNSQEVFAFADWAGLRPMSEMEFEKACRGVNIPAVPNEYAWGSNGGFSNLTTLNNGSQYNESVNQPTTANALIGGNVNRPVRVGIFARPAGSIPPSSRALSGATYYGVMNMSDNVYEQVIYSGNNDGQNVTSTIHGNGYLNANGTTDIITWNFYATGLRGSFYDGNTNNARISDRQYSLYSSNSYSEQKGIRLVRSAQ